MNILELFVPVLLSFYGCFMQPEVVGANRMYGSKEVKSGQFPQLVRLKITFKDTDITSKDWFWCSASLIGYTWVMTAAHCVRDNGVKAKKIMGFMGSHQFEVNEVNVTVPFPTTNGTKVPIKFNSTGEMQHDIAVLRIPRVSPSKTIKVVPLPSLQLFKNNTYLLNKIVYTIGWGYLNDTGDNTNIARYSEFTVVPLKYCREKLGVRMLKSFLCLKSPTGAGACPGDSGGPSILKATGELVGVTSYGSDKGCAVGEPFVATYVNHYTKWIRRNTRVFNP